MSMQITLRLREYQTVITEAISAEQAELLKKQFSRHLSVQPAWGGGYEIRAQQYVGVIALDGLRIHIQPKVPLDNLFYMLTYAYNLPDFRKERADVAVADDLFEFMVDIFVRQVDALVRQGIHHAYVDREENERYLRGRLLMAQQIQHNLILQDRLYQQRNEYTDNVMENQILQHTLALLSRQHYRQPSLRQRIRRTSAAFVGIEPRFIRPFDCTRVHYNRLNERYRSRINLAHLLLQHLSLEGAAGNQRFFAFLFDMNQLFELFVAHYLKEHFDAHPSLTLEIQPNIWLDTDRKETGRPDLILRQQGQPLLILDTKYKTFADSPTPDDRNQMVTYCHTMHLARSLLIYADAAPVHYAREFRGIFLTATSLPLDGSLENLRQRCQIFAQGLADHSQARAWSDPLQIDRDAQ